MKHLAVLIQSTRVTECLTYRQTDRQTDRRKCRSIDSHG